MHEALVIVYGGEFWHWRISDPYVCGRASFFSFGGRAHDLFCKRGELLGKRSLVELLYNL